MSRHLVQAVALAAALVGAPWAHAARDAAGCGAARTAGSGTAERTSSPWPLSDLRSLQSRLEKKEDRSALFTAGAPPVSTFRSALSASRDARPADLLGLVAQPENAEPEWLAAVVTPAAQDGLTIELHWHERAADSAQAAMLNLAGLEQLYDEVRRLSARATFVIVPDGSPATAPVNKARALSGIARLRECAATQLLRMRPDAPVRRWRDVSVVDARSADPRRDPLEVAARITSAGRPLTGATVGFERAPDLICIARVDASGHARCRLFDPHPHPGHDDDPASDAPTDVTVSGDVGSRFIDLPTTVTLAGAAAP